MPLPETGGASAGDRPYGRRVIRGVLLDFYGTVVDEDDDVIDTITQRIAADRPEHTPEKIAGLWGQAFAAATAAASDGFRPQRDVAVRALAQVLADIGSDLDVTSLCRPQLTHWRTAALRPGSTEFLDACPVPICVVSNIDTDDLDAVVAHHQLDLPVRVTSEDVRSYKPRPEIFLAALDRLGLTARDVLHVGDSLTSDVGGANALGIPVAWVNRHARPRPPHASIGYEITDLRDLLPTLGQR
jgi:2-haloacid dehalogenase/putative hydrolase of the HAD superfamily